MAFRNKRPEVQFPVCSSKGGLNREKWRIKATTRYHRAVRSGWMKRRCAFITGMWKKTGTASGAWSVTESRRNIATSGTSFAKSLGGSVSGCCPTVHGSVPITSSLSSRILSTILRLRIVLNFFLPPIWDRTQVVWWNVAGIWSTFTLPIDNLSMTMNPDISSFIPNTNNRLITGIKLKNDDGTFPCDEHRYCYFYTSCFTPIILEDTFLYCRERSSSC